MNASFDATKPGERASLSVNVRMVTVALGTGVLKREVPSRSSITAVLSASTVLNLAPGAIIVIGPR